MVYSSRLGLKPGSSGAPISVTTNSFAVATMPTRTFTHYDEFPTLTKLPNRQRCLEIIEKLQLQEAALFNPRAAYDGQRNLFRSVPLDLPNNGGTFKVFNGDARPGTNPNVRGLEVRITKVALIDPRSIREVMDGRGSHSPQSLTTMTLLNVLIRQQPIMTYPSNARSFFTKDIREHLGQGLELWRGLFQSVRPTIGRLLVNVDIATAVMYNSGPLIDLMMAFLGCRDARDLSPHHIKPHMERKLNQFLKGLFVATNVPPPKPGKPQRYRKLFKIVMMGADQYRFTNDTTGETLSITEHFMKTHRFRVQLGGVVCVEISKGVVYPIEVLKVKEGQMYKKMLPPSLAPRALKFATQRPRERVQAIESGAGLLGYATSDYLRQSGMSISPHLISIKARVLAPPPIQWGGDQRPEIPRDGAWNVLRKTLYSPVQIQAWSVVLYETSLNRQVVGKFLKTFMDACNQLGMSEFCIYPLHCREMLQRHSVIPAFPSTPPPIIEGRPQGGEENHEADMDRAGFAAVNAFQAPKPTFILVILPDSAIEIRTSVKRWGDCSRGIPTQCMRREKLLKANNQYCNNLALKVNTKLGGVNCIPSSAGDPQSNKMFNTMQWLLKEPTMIIGADVSHAAPNSDRPSVTGLVSSLDDHFCQYVASCEVQRAREEIIEDLPKMMKNAVQKFYLFWKVVRRRDNVFPQRIIFFRDGVSEGQFIHVGHREVNIIKETLSELWKDKKLPGRPPKLTFIVVAKKHHVRFFPQRENDADKSGNCPAGMVVDQEIVSPVDYDYYLQSHGGLLGTSRPSHYSVIEDGNGLDANRLQEISYALCHVYARATRSVSIPAPVYYADIVCARGRFHSKLIHDGGDESAMASGEVTLEQHKSAFKGLAKDMSQSMYFM